MRPAQLIETLGLEAAESDPGNLAPLMIWGPPGIGKSAIIRQVGDSHDLPVVDIRLSQLEPSDLRGIPFREDGLVNWAIPSMLPDATRHGERGLLFLDELTSALPSVAAAAYQLILDRRLGDYRLPAGWLLAAAGNRSGDRGVTYVMPAPLANRFVHYELELNLEDWTHWAYQHEIDARIIAFLKFRPDLLFEFDPAENPVAFPTPRTWEYASLALRKFSTAPNLLASALQGCVGVAAATECKAFIDNLSQLPDVDALINGGSPPLPTGVDLQYALATAIVTRIARLSPPPPTMIDHVLAEAGRFSQKEIGTMMIVDMARHIGNPVFESEAFGRWARETGNELLF